MLQDLCQVSETSAELLCLVAHRGTIVKQHSVEVHAFSKSQLSTAFLLLAGLAAWLPQRSFEDRSGGLLV
jgi:hypothetical protein